MKNLLLACLFLCPTVLLADPWENMTYEQAEKAVEFLENDPYILDYCDCCDFEGEYASDIHLMKVISAEIVPCEWNSEYYSVKTQVVILAELPYTESGPDITDPLVYEFKTELMITMNYTWAYNNKLEKAAPLYTIIPYDVFGGQKSDSGQCREFTTFPKPEVINDEAYEEWYNER